MDLNWPLHFPAAIQQPYYFFEMEGDGGDDGGREMGREGEGEGGMVVGVGTRDGRVLVVEVGGEMKVGRKVRGRSAF